MKKRRPLPHDNRERWLVSYADFITLLFAFFVVLYASSQVDKRKMGQLASAIQQAFQQMGMSRGGSAASAEPNNELFSSTEEGKALARVLDASSERVEMSRADLPSLKRELQLALAPEIGRNEVALQIGPEGLTVSLREIGFFNSGSATLRPESEPAFARIASLLLQYDCSVRVEGHTDNVPIHTRQFASNWELSTARATEVIRIFIVQFGYDPERLSAAGYGEYHPAASNDSDEGRRVNRRIDLVVLGTSRNLAAASHASKSSAIHDKVGSVLSR